MSPKSLERMKTLEDDWISSLPDDLLCHILSLLPTKHSVATTALSTRWNQLFTCVPILDFDDSLDSSGTANEIAFITFLTRTIFAVINELLYVREFRLNCQRGTYPCSVISFWISIISSGNLQELCVSAKSVTKPAPLTPRLFYCRALTMLRLDGNFLLFVPDYVIFPSLKTLELSELVLAGDESVQKFIHGCIMLEKLSLYDCVLDSISVLEVPVASLKHLTLSGMNGDYEFLPDAPGLGFFDCSSYATRGYFRDELNSLDNAIVDIGLEDEHFEDEKVSELVNMVSNARLLELSGDSLEPLTYQTATFHNLTKLKVQAYRAAGWLSLPNLLRSTPFLEVLSFYNGLYDDYAIYPETALYLPESAPVCVSAHLKEVEVQIIYGKDEELEMVEYFLKHAKVLKKMIIKHESFESRISSMKERIPIMRRLLNLPRGSRDWMVINITNFCCCISLILQLFSTW